MKRPSAAHQARSVARLAAVQALYQLEASGVGVEAVIREFVDHRFDGDIEGQTLAPADIDYFIAIVRGVVERGRGGGGAGGKGVVGSWAV